MGYTKINNNYIFGAIIGITVYTLIFGALTISAEYYSLPQIKTSTIQGGQVSNVSFSDKGYFYTYFDAQKQQFFEGYTKYKVVEGETIFSYTVFDSQNIPYLYPTRVWTQLEIDGEIVYSSKTSEAITILITLITINTLMYGVMAIKRFATKNK